MQPSVPNVLTTDTQIDNRPLPRRLEMREDRAAPVECPDKVEHDGIGPALRIAIVDKSERVHRAGIVDDDIQPPEPCDDGIDKGTNFFIAAGIADKALCRAAG